MISSITRWTTTQTSHTNYGGAYGLLSSANEATSGNVGGHIGVDEFVFDSSTGALASFQEPPALASLLNSNDGSCSFII